MSGGLHEWPTQNNFDRGEEKENIQVDLISVWTIKFFQVA